MKRIVLLVLMMVSAVTVALSSQPVAWAGCYADSEVEPRSITVEPNLECIEIQIAGSSCIGGVDVNVINNCENAINLVLLDPEPFAQTGFDILPGDQTMDNVQITDERSLEYLLDIEGNSHKIVIEYDANETNVEACSTGGPVTGSFLVLFIAMVAFGGRLRKENRP